MTWVAQVSAEDDCRVVLSESEWKALYCFRNKTKILPQNIPRVQKTMRWIAMHGGFLGRKGDVQPSTATTWQGWQRVRKITKNWELFTSPALTP